MNALKIYCEDPNCRPTRAHSTDAGLDLRAAVSVSLSIINTPVAIPTGVNIEIPPGYVGLIFPRSGLASKQGIILANTIGVIDSDYRGEVICMVKKTQGGLYRIEQYERIAQLVIIPCDLSQPEFVNKFEELSITERGEGGFGHTGKH